AKTFYLGNASSAKKQLDRHVDEWELRLTLSEKDRYHWTNGVLYYLRDADYQWRLTGLSEEEAESTKEAPSPNIRRDEAGAYTTFFSRIPVAGWRSHGYQIGLYYNHVRLNRGGTIRQ